MRSLRASSLERARARSEELMGRVARALVEAELEGYADLDAPSALRFLDSMDELLALTPFAVTRLCVRLADHGSPAVRRAVASSARQLAPTAPNEAELLLTSLADDAQAPVRAAAARALSALVAHADDPFVLVRRWLSGTAGQRDAMERARRRLPAPIGTAPIRRREPQAANESTWVERQ
jgi:hypothetical protein